MTREIIKVSTASETVYLLDMDRQEFIRWASTHASQLENDGGWHPYDALVNIADEEAGLQFYWTDIDGKQHLRVSTPIEAVETIRVS